MKIAGVYSFNRGEEEITDRYPTLLAEVEETIASVNAGDHRTKVSKEKTMPGRMLFSPSSLNKAFKGEFGKRDWNPIRVSCDYPTEYYTEGYKAKRQDRRGAFREIDFVKETLGVEIQFGKYSFMVYNVCAKMTIFNKLGYIKCGIEVVPVKSFADEMSSGVSYFEQFVWDLENRGVADIDIPVLILGLDD